MFKRAVFLIIVGLCVLVLGGSRVDAQGGPYPYPAPYPQPTQPPAAGPFFGEFFTNKDLFGAAVATRSDTAIAFDWGTGSPYPGIVGTDYFSARWQGTVSLAPGTYRFTLTVDDGARLWVNGRLLIDSWRAQARATYTADVTLSGSTAIRLDYFEQTGGASVSLTWAARGTQPPPPQPTVAPAPPAGAIYVVQRGDTLSTIATRFRTTVNAIMQVNGLRSTAIYIGQRLIIPGNNQPQPQPTVAPPQSAIYLVQRGDTLSTIATRFRTTVNAIMQVNGLRSTTIYIGQRLIIPASGNPPPAQPTPQAAEIIVDETSPDFVRGGSNTGWQGASSVGYNRSMIWVLNNQTEQANYNWARWYPRLRPGRYEVFAFIPSRNASTRNAVYNVVHADGIAQRRVNQDAVSDVWVSLGTYRFNGGNGEYVSLNDITGEPALSVRVGFDAMRWVAR